MKDFLDQLHASARRLPVFRRLAIISRILLAIGFIPTGMVKLVGNRFTIISVETQIGAFFEAMYQSGFYWHFIGLGQVLAGILILIPATSTLGAVLFFPIILNVTVITWSLQFPGTVYITALMLLANVFLLCWDYDRWRTILFEPAVRPAVPAAAPLPTIERVGYAVGTATGLAMLLGTRSFLPMSLAKVLFPIGCVAAVMVAAGWVQASRRSRELAA